MDSTAIANPPKRITDLVNLKKQGYDPIIDLSFDIVPVNFAHQNHEYQAFIFLCRYSGTVQGKSFAFRKCYAKGCPHNLCPHVAQAVMIANRYLKRDYKKLADAGIAYKEIFFSLEDMVVKYEGIDQQKDETTGGILTIHDYINIARQGNAVKIQINLESICGVEHFANQKNEQIFLMGNFNISCLGRATEFQRCFACFKTDAGQQEKTTAISTANDRLRLLFNEFAEAKIQYGPCFFN